MSGEPRRAGREDDREGQQEQDASAHLGLRRCEATRRRSARPPRSRRHKAPGPPVPALQDGLAGYPAGRAAGGPPARICRNGLSRISASAPPRSPVTTSSPSACGAPAHSVAALSSLTSPPPSQPRANSTAPPRNTASAQPAAPSAAGRRDRRRRDIKRPCRAEQQRQQVRDRQPPEILERGNRHHGRKEAQGKDLQDHTAPSTGSKRRRGRVGMRTGTAAAPASPGCGLRSRNYREGRLINDYRG